MAPNTNSAVEHNVAPYWIQVRHFKNTLPQAEVFYLTSIPPPLSNATPQVFPATRDIAAEYLARGTHRLSDPAEIEQFHANDEALTLKYAKAELERKKGNVYFIERGEAAQMGLVPAAGKKGKE